MSEAGLRIRVDDSLRYKFIEACKGDDTTASQVIRAYMRSYVEERAARDHSPSRQTSVHQGIRRRVSHSTRI